MKFIVHEPTSNTRKVYSMNGPETVDGLSKIPKSIGQMKGDIIVFRGESDPIILPVGTDGQILKADSSTPSGLKWVNP